MRELLRTLAEHLVFLLDPGRYRLVNSYVGSTYGDAWVALEGEVLVWRVVRDRSQIFLECRECDGPNDKWYSTDVLIRLLTGQRVDSAELTEETANWVEQNLGEIESRFRTNLAGTIDELQELKRKRAKELFG
jgi:hypothetical protein